MAADLNTITLVGRLARDPELRSLPSGTLVCELRLAYTTSKKDGASGQWEDVSNFVNVTVWGNQGESVARHLTKGKRVGISGRLEHRTWKDKEGNNRETHSVVANTVQFLSPKEEGQQGGGGFSQREARPAQPAYTPAPADDDIPF